ncbi:hypothetical protein P618_200114 [Holospora obtusa F1]|uniref:Uncharacterized protein n=1 Tax=Holospora obtusa F1 TaxID=1399147 RepID=W6TV76_HOLOB|nr:hypothetical protein P618_200114 [Holospora obtusa F1]
MHKTPSDLDTSQSSNTTEKNTAPQFGDTSILERKTNVNTSQNFVDGQTDDLNTSQSFGNNESDNLTRSQSFGDDESDDLNRSQFIGSSSKDTHKSLNTSQKFNDENQNFTNTSQSSQFGDQNFLNGMNNKNQNFTNTSQSSQFGDQNFLNGMNNKNQNFTNTSQSSQFGNLPVPNEMNNKNQNLESTSPSPHLGDQPILKETIDTKQGTARQTKSPSSRMDIQSFFEIWNTYVDAYKKGISKNLKNESDKIEAINKNVLESYFKIRTKFAGKMTLLSFDHQNILKFFMILVLAIITNNTDNFWTTTKQAEIKKVLQDLVSMLGKTLSIKDFLSTENIQTMCKNFDPKDQKECTKFLSHTSNF